MNHRGGRYAFTMSAWTIVLIAGCGQATDTDPRITGTVTLDQSPLEFGTVLFQPADPGVAPQMAEVKAGTFELRAKPGKYRVEIQASRQVPNKSGRYGEPIYESIIPDRYHSKTILRADVVSKGSNTQSFELESD